jgi:transposase-like protein
MTRFATMKVAPHDILVKCPQCEAWPMALAPNEGIENPNKVTFRCPKCHAQFVYTVGVAGSLILAPAMRP